MTLDLNGEERNFLLELLNSAHPEMQHELHHTDTLDYRTGLRRRIDVLERLTAKIVALHEA